MSKTVLSDLKGVNATKSPLQLKAGEAQNMQNMRGRPFHNWAKRKGIEFNSSSTEPINGIFEFDLDTITIPIFQAGGTLTFFPDLSTQSFPNPDPYPIPDPLDPNGVYTFILFLLEPAIRGIQERCARINLTSGWYVQRFFDANGFIPAGEDPPQISGNSYYTGNANGYWWPPNSFYAFDLANYDAHFGQPFGTRAAQLINSIRDVLNDNVFLGYYADPSFPIQNASSVTFYTTTSLPVPAAATPSTYRSRLVDLRTAIKKLEYITLVAGASFPIPNAKSLSTTLEASAAAALSCVNANYTTAPYGSQSAFAAPCTLFATIPVSPGNTGFGITVGADMPFQSTARMASCLISFGWDVSPYPIIVSGEAYAQFISAISTYFAPTAYGSPPVNTLGKLANGYGSTLTLSISDVEGDRTTMVNNSNSANGGLSWGIDTVPIHPLVLRLGFTVNF